MQPPPSPPSSLKSIPHRSLLLCATDPVVASDGHSYERSAILSVLHNGNGLSPLTREQLQTAVYPNRALKRRMLDHDEDMLAAIAAANAAAGPNNRCTPLQVPSSQRAPKRSLRAR